MVMQHLMRAATPGLKDGTVRADRSTKADLSDRTAAARVITSIRSSILILADKVRGTLTSMIFLAASSAAAGDRIMGEEMDSEVLTDFRAVGAAGGRISARRGRMSRLRFRFP